MDRLADLAARVPAGGDPDAAWAAVEDRASTVRRRRRLATTGAAAMLLICGLGALLLTDGDSGGTDVATVASTTEADPATVSTTAPPMSVRDPSETVPATAVPSGDAPVESSLCRRGLEIDGDVPTEGEALVLVGFFLQDRADQTISSSRRGDPWACLAENVVSAYDGSTLCMNTCGQRVVSVPSQIEPMPFGSTGDRQIVTVLLDSSDGPFREEYQIGAVDGRALILTAEEMPASFVDEGEAREVIETFLAALQDEDWPTAYRLLINEGASDAVLAEIPDVLEGGPSTIADWCVRTGRCSGASVVGSLVYSEPFALTFEVDFGERGLATMRAGAFEGQLTVGALPPPL